jgi:hypothetical protein
MNGLQHGNVGKCVTRFFESQTEYHVITTTIRSMFETETSEGVGIGLIKLHEGNTVHCNSGHSFRTAQHHYLKQKAETTASQAMATHEKLYNLHRTLGPPTPSRFLQQTSSLIHRHHGQHNSAYFVDREPDNVHYNHICKIGC